MGTQLVSNNSLGDDGGLWPRILQGQVWLRAGLFKSNLRHVVLGRSHASDSAFPKSISSGNRVFARAGALTSVAPVMIIGVFIGIIGTLVIGALVWIFVWRPRQKARDEEHAQDVASRPFPLSAKPGRSRLQPSISTVLQVSPPEPVKLASPHRRRRRRPPPPPPLIPTDQNRSSAQREHRARRSSISKSVLSWRWRLPPISEGYGVGLMTREISDFGLLQSHERHPDQ
ncbi:hypothetical protein GGX14DRAFT_481301 [Mycena pura]|uniref:Uncharacterized protein n=1 Tax=Mycena pura TaxID=153505 RepID=A0AAD6UNU4_9AGAR|nr:hypothetical protein GGX14DRAFT_481301 [Mycena pura]